VKARKPAGDRKAEILEAALDLAFHEGPDRVTTGMIAQRLGLTQPAIYKHFPSKDDIWQSVAQNLCDQIASNIAQAAARATHPVEHIRMLILGHLQLVHRTPALPEIMVVRDPKGEQTTVQKEMQASMADFFRTLVQVITKAQGGGALRAEIDARDIATLVFGVIQGLVLRLLVTRNPDVLLEDSERLLDLQISAFATNGDHT